MKIIIEEQIERGHGYPIYDLEVQDPRHLVEGFGLYDLTERMVVREIKRILKQNKRRRLKYG